MPSRPAVYGLVPAALGVIAAGALWRAFTPATTLAGLAAGGAAGLVAGWLLSRTWLQPAAALGLLARLAAAAGVFAAGLAIVARDPAVVGDAPNHIWLFLSIGLPADGLEHLVVVPYVVAALTVATTVWAALRARTHVAVIMAVGGFLAASLLAAPVGVPPAVPLGFMVFVGADLLMVSRIHYSELEPLVGSSTAIRRNVSLWRSSTVGGLAAAVGAAALVLPTPVSFDVRRFVEPDTTVLPDENPLAVAARLLVNPPDGAEGLDVTVTVDGPSPGRLRLAVLGGYEPEGWRQLASFAVTGTHLDDPLVSPSPIEPSSVLVEFDPEATTGLLAVPTAGTPLEVSDATGLRFDAGAGLLLSLADHEHVDYRTAIDAGLPDDSAEIAGRLPATLVQCPDSELLESLATQLSAARDDPLMQLEAIVSWLKLRRIYDPGAPGGQTLGSVERFLAQDFARGNLEVFITSFALLGRCAGVPLRIVVGYLAPEADAITDYEPSEITAWVEVPIEGVGWFGIDPVPTPDEQQRQRELAEAPPPTDPPDDPEPDEEDEPEPIEVPPQRRDLGIDPVRVALTVLVAIIAAAIGLYLLGAAVRHRTLRRRRHVADPALAGVLAWTTAMERLHDNDLRLGPHLTASETARATAGRVPVPVTLMLRKVSGIVDLARFDRDRATIDDAGLAWALADESLRRLPNGLAVRLGPLRNPRRAWRRLRLTRGLARRRRRWTADVPTDVVVVDDVTPEIPGYRIEARIGSGSSAVVFRAIEEGTGRAAAAKVFTVADGTRFDPQRFVWESRVAELVSGRPHLPEVYAAGFTEAGQPYLVTKHYARGTLAQRVRLGGAMPTQQVTAVGRQVATALETLHEHGIVHADVKPENIFIDDDDSMILGDLGASWVHSGGSRPAAMTPAYAAPEVALGHAPSAAADLYSLGLTLLFAATGRWPVPGSPPTEDAVVAAFGSDIAVPLLQVDARRRPRSALVVANRFGADLVEHTVSGDTPARLPPPSWTVRNPTRQ